MRDPPDPSRSKVRGLYGQRPSRSHDEIRRREFERIAALTPLERMIEALELDEESKEVLAQAHDVESSRRPSR